MQAERIEKLAAEWFERRISGQWTDDDQARLDAWLNESLAHEIQYLRIETAWTHASRLQALGAGIKPGTIPERHSWGDTRFLRTIANEAPLRAQPGPLDVMPTPTPDIDAGRNGSTGADRRAATALAAARVLGASHEDGDPRGHGAAAAQGLGTAGEVGVRDERRPLSWKGLRFAAAAAAVTIAASAYLYLQLAIGDRYSTPVGGMRNLVLKDGSHITLNTDTRLRASLKESERHVELERGEAFFDVAKDPQRPFVVVAGDRRIVVVGTRFSVRREHDVVRVVVTEGKVRIEADDHRTNSVASAPNTGEPTKAVLLSAGAVANASPGDVRVSESGSAAVENLLSWRNGYINFDNVPLAEAVAEFNRYRTPKIEIVDPSIAGLRIGGNFRSDSSEAFLAVLETGFGIDVQRRDDGVVLKARH